MHRMMRRERIKRGWTQAFVAKQVGVTSETIRLIENGNRNPSYSILIKLENLFQTGHRALFDTDTE